MSFTLNAEWMDPSAANNAADESALIMEAFPLKPPAVPTDITLGLVPVPEGIHMAVHGDGNLFAPPTMKRMISRIYTILEGAAGDAHQAQGHQARLVPKDLEEVMDMSMGEERPEYLSGPLVHEAFASCGCQSP